MNFDFSDTQYALRDLARDLFAKESPPSRVRELWDGKPFDRRVWKTMAEAGLTGLTVPEEYGGSGGDEVDLALVYEEAGRAALPEPLLETTGIAATLLSETGTDEQRERWLPGIASGDVLVTVESPFEEHAAWGAEADLLVCERDSRVHAVPRGRFSSTAVVSVDPARPIATVVAEVGDDTYLCDSGGPEWTRAGRRAGFGGASLLNGISQHLLEATISYVKDRRQFGRPVGSFQALKHKLASMHVAIESSRPAAWYAAYAIARSLPDAGVAANVAKAAASEVEALCNREALQCHGGIGFTWEHDLHLWLKRGIALRSSYGTAAAHRRALVQTVVDADFLEGAPA